MPTPPKGPRLGGGPAHERLMLAGLATSLFEHRRITTTEAKAKRLRPLAERLIAWPAPWQGLPSEILRASSVPARMKEAVPMLPGMKTGWPMPR